MQHHPITHKVSYFDKIYQYKDINSYSSLLKKISRDTGLPSEAIILQESQSKLLVKDGKCNPSNIVKEESQLLRIHNLDLKIKPCEKDYFKIIYSIWLNLNDAYYLLSPLNDLHPIQEVKDETNYYLMTAVNNGVYTRGEGIIHVQPSIAPVSSLSEGLNATLKLFFPVIGINYSCCDEKNKPKLIINNYLHLIRSKNVTSSSGHTPIQSLKKTMECKPTSKMQWYLFVWNHYQDYKRLEKPTVYIDDFDKIWLFADEAIFIFMYLDIKNHQDLPEEVRDKVDIVTLGQIKFFQKIK
jgi:hypothetical protein